VDADVPLGTLTAVGKVLLLLGRTASAGGNKY
jgi:hypothetical protein